MTAPLLIVYFEFKHAETGFKTRRAEFATEFETETRSRARRAEVRTLEKVISNEGAVGSPIKIFPETPVLKC